jgi:hypothetical protein
MPRYTTLQDIQDTKDKHHHHWEWDPGKMPEKKNKTPSRAYYYLTCGLCKNKHWVLFSNIKKGVSKCCARCSKLPTLEKMHALIKKHNMLWIPSLIHKPGSKSRYFWMKCGGCSKHFWVRWQRFSQGAGRACRSCSKRQSAGSIKDPTKFYKHPIRVAWRRILFDHGVVNKEIKGTLPEWKDFSAFKDWCMSNGFSASTAPTLEKKDKKKPYTPENSYWKRTKETDKNTISMRSY